MKVFLIEFDNGRQYDDRENYTVGVFNSYEKAVNYCLENGYVETLVKGLFKPKDEHYFNDTYSLEIVEAKMNVAINEVKDRD